MRLAVPEAAHTCVGASMSFWAASSYPGRQCGEEEPALSPALPLQRMRRGPAHRHTTPFTGEAEAFSH